jgi:hypothetical protein
MFLLFTFHAGSAFDDAFLPLIVVPASVGLVLCLVRRVRWLGFGLVVGAACSLGLQAAFLISIPFIFGAN